MAASLTREHENLISANVDRFLAGMACFRSVVSTTEKMQIAFLNLEGPSDDLPLESHPQDQFFLVRRGSATITIMHPDGSPTVIKCGPNDYVHVPANFRHSLEVGRGGCKLMTIYSGRHLPANGDTLFPEEPPSGTPPAPMNLYKIV